MNQQLEDTYNAWYEKNFNKLRDKFLKDNGDLQILDDDISDLEQNQLFIDYVEEGFDEYCNTRDKHGK